MSSETKQRILKRAVSQCPSITMEFLGLKVPSLLDLGSMVMLICEAYFNKNILPLLCSSVEELAEAHSLFRLSAANNQEMPVSRYFEADVSILGFRIPSVGFLVVKDPSTVLESQYSTRTPRVIRCNLIRLGYKEFERVFGFEAFETFTCPKEVHPLIFAQMCTLYHQGKDQTAQPDIHTSDSKTIVINKPMKFMQQVQILISKQHQKTSALQMQLLDRYGLAAHARLFASPPIQRRSFKAQPLGRPDEFLV